MIKQFNINGNCNRHNLPYLGNENPQKIGNMIKISVKSTFAVPIISPLCFEVTVLNCECYLEMLQNYFIPELKRLTLTRNTDFQQGGAPCHSSHCVRQF
jgi:hypothetical protein